ncbi:MAG: ABC transporter permease subunit [Clostridia bacterium]|nr:ABC transporter permease subunit [Clostridia bacterium]
MLDENKTLDEQSAIESTQAVPQEETVETVATEEVAIQEKAVETVATQEVAIQEEAVADAVEVEQFFSQEKEAVEKKAERSPNVKVRKCLKAIGYYTAGTIMSLIFLFPLLYMLATSTKTEQQYAFDAGSLMMFLPNVTDLATAFGNYANVITGYGMWQYTINTILYAAVIIVLNIIINGLAGYAMAKFNFPGKGFFSFIILFLIVVPVETSIIPLYSIVNQMLHLTDSNMTAPLAIILPASISIFNIFLFMQFFEGIPKEYEEAARIDGAGTLRIFFSMILPLSKPIVATVATFCFIGTWNDYVWPTMVLPYPEEGMWPLWNIQAGLTSVKSATGVTTGEIMASLVVASVPIFIVYVVAQKYIVQGFGSAGLKM